MTPSKPKDLKAKVWVSEGMNYQFAEQEQNVKNNTGVCFSGGGTRSLSAVVGQLRGLRHLGLIKNIDYISCVSGGSWASTAYTYYQSGPKDDTQFLGPMTEPKKLTLANLKELDPNCLGYTATKSLRNALWDLFTKGTPFDELWSRAIGQIYFEQFGIYSPDTPAYFSLDSETVDDIKRRNPFLGDAVFRTVRTEEKRPFLVINSCLLGPYKDAPLAKENPVVFQYTPLYVGTPFLNEVTFDPRYHSKETLPVGGGFIEPFAFGGNAPAQPPASGMVEAPMADRMFTVTEASGASSTAYASYFENRMIIFEGKYLNPRRPYWPFTPSFKQPAVEYNFGDGGNLENFGLISLLQRKVKNIVVFVNSNQKLNLDYNPSHVPGQGDLDAGIPTLFGYAEHPTGCWMQNNQVFSKGDFANLVTKLQAAKKKGDSVIASTTLPVQKNNWWGLEGGWDVNVTWVYNDRVANWEKLLDKNIQNEINKGNDFIPCGDFANFPNYKTMFENFGDLVELTPAQVNLLADLSCWNITSNPEIFEKALIK